MLDHARSLINQYDYDLSRSYDMYIKTGNSFWELTPKQLKDMSLFAIIRYYEELGRINARKNVLKSQLHLLPKG